MSLRSSEYSSGLIPPPCNTPKCEESVSRMITWADYVNKIEIPPKLQENVESKNVAVSVFDNILNNAYLLASGDFSESSKSVCSTETASSRSEDLDRISLQSEDFRLVNWKYWLEERKNKFDNIARTSNKHPDDSIINTIENRRKFVKRAEVMTKAIEFKKFNELRGADTVFWKIPERLRPINGLGDCFTTFRKSELVEKPEIEYTQVPDIILEELNINKTKAENKFQVFSSDYYKQRVNQLQEDIHSIEEFEPQMDNLVVVGEKAKFYTETCSPRTQSTDDMCCGSHALHPTRYSAVYTLNASDVIPPLKSRVSSINIQSNRLSEIMKQPKDLKIDLIFDTEVGTVCESSIEFSNIGDKAIDFNWLQLPLNNIYKNTVQYFFFDKNKFRVIPNETKILKVWFKSDVAGIFKESWYLHTEPNFFKTGCNLIVKFWCSNGDPHIRQRMADLEQPIIHNTAKRSIKLMVDRLVDSSLAPCPVEPCPDGPTIALEFMRKNPKLTYNTEIVDKLIEISEILGFTDWNLDVHALYFKIFEIEDDDDRKTIYEDYKNCINELKFVKLQTREDPAKMNKKQNVLQLVKGIIGTMIDNIDEIGQKFYDDKNGSEVEEEIVSHQGSGDHVGYEDYCKDLFFMKTYCNVKKTIQEVAVIIESNL